MLYELSNKGQHKSIKRTHLQKIGWKETDLETMIINNINDFISSRTLMPIFKQRRRQEEPDILAIDVEGNLYILELKRWSGTEENLLQVLRYGQLYGSSEYDHLNKMYSIYIESKTKRDDLLKKHHQQYFGLKEELDANYFNQEQKFVVVTNGIDQKTLEAIEYWKKQGIKIDPLIYWVYEINSKNYIEIDRYMPNNNLIDYETNSYIINTNINNSQESHNEMISREIAAAYVTGWKEKIDKLQIGDQIFLYQSGKGVIASGIVNSARKSEEWHNIPNNKYYVDLKEFKNISKNPISPSTMQELKGAGFPFRTTMYSIDDETSKKLKETIASKLK